MNYFLGDTLTNMWSPPSPQPRAVNVDLQNDAMLQVDISDALSERDKVKFTVHTKVCFPPPPCDTRAGMIRLMCWLVG